jgi:hypothetical protein
MAAPRKVAAKLYMLDEAERNLGRTAKANLLDSTHLVLKMTIY